MSGAAPLRPPLGEMVTLLRAARRLEDAWGAALELCLVTLALPWEVVAIEIERIDWERGTVPVPARGGVDRALALSHDAQRAILRIAGEAGGRGQVVTAGRGPRLEAPMFRLDRLVDKLAVAAPETIALAPWNFHGVREEAADQLARAGASRAELDAVLGRRPANAGRTANRKSAVRPIRGVRPVRGDVELAALGAERWSRILAEAGRTATSKGGAR